eukprot:TRINITY_DN16692_c0_g1_i1.p1 TRINITY_DN16692_c0_g1~~TRINITY_DN16692_c0_g1_i1.p1  ORF type:complete len:417 (-),score=57.68 TRINITY_DN16692_c0_g1_i1:99-1349(-)
MVGELDSGIELFRQLVRVWPTAQAEDYYNTATRNWDDELMRTDIELITVHRKEAGAPEPPELEDVKMPKLPFSLAAAVGQKATPGTGAAAPMALGAVKPVTAAGVGARPAGVVSRPLVAVSRAAPVPVKSAPAGAKALPRPAAAGSSDDLRLVALLVAKWKLDPTRTKVLLAKLPAAKRRYVITNFKASAAGPSANAELQAFIAECDRTNGWAASGSPASAVKAPVPVAGVKRPLSAVAALAPGANTRPRLATTSSAGTLRPGTATTPRPATSLGAALRSASAPPALAARRVPAPVRAATPRPGVVAAATPRPPWGSVSASVAARPALRPGVAPSWPSKPAAPAPRAKAAPAAYGVRPATPRPAASPGAWPVGKTISKPVVRPAAPWAAAAARAPARPVAVPGQVRPITGRTLVRR